MFAERYYMLLQRLAGKQAGRQEAGKVGIWERR